MLWEDVLLHVFIPHLSNGYMRFKAALLLSIVLLCEPFLLLSLQALLYGGKLSKDVRVMSSLLSLTT